MFGAIATAAAQVFLLGLSAYGVAYSIGGVSKSLKDVGDAWGSDETTSSDAPVRTAINA